MPLPDARRFPILRSTALRTAALLGAVAALAAPARAQTTINFESFTAGTLLSDQLLASNGVRFRSTTNPSVAVVLLGSGHATSGVNGVTAAPGVFSEVFSASFFNPLNTAQQATVGSVSIRADLLGSGGFGGGPVRLRGFDVFGTLLGETSAVDLNGPTLSLALAGIHRVDVVPNGTSAFDDLQFGPLTPFVSPPSTTIPEPSTVALVAGGLAAVATAARRRQTTPRA